MTTATTHGAWCALAPASALEYQQVKAKTPDDDDVDVTVMYCGLCGSDATALLGETRALNPPRVCGHEIVGRIARIGPAVSGFQVGDMVGIGAQCDSCRECSFCLGGNPQYCLNMVFTYGGARYTRGAARGEMNNGGFSDFWRGSSKFILKLPEGLDPSTAGPLLCAGATVYSPLKEHGAGTTAKNVGVIGVGGLGHMAIMIATAMGADVTAISRGNEKRSDAEKLGAKGYIPTSTDLVSDFKDHANTLDLIICTINPETLPVAEYMPLLRPRGAFVLVGIVPRPLEVPTGPLVLGGRCVRGSIIASPSDMADLLSLAVAKHIVPWVQKFPMSEINAALREYRDGKARYRYVLVNTDNGGVM